MKSVAKKSGKSKGATKRAEKPASGGIRRAAKRMGLSPRTQRIAVKNEKLRAGATLVVARHATPPVSATEKAAVTAAKQVDTLRAMQERWFATPRDSRGELSRKLIKLERDIAFHKAVALRGTKGGQRKPYYTKTPGDAIRIALHGSDDFHPSRIAEGVCVNLAVEARLLIPAIMNLVQRTKECASLEIEDTSRLTETVCMALRAMATRAELVRAVFSDIEAANVEVFTPEEIADLERASGGAS